MTNRAELWITDEAVFYRDQVTGQVFDLQPDEEYPALPADAVRLVPHTQTDEAIQRAGYVRIDGAALERVARELWRQDYGNGVSFPDAGRRHSLYLNKARAALTALNPSPEEK